MIRYDYAWTMDYEWVHVLARAYLISKAKIQGSLNIGYRVKFRSKYAHVTLFNNKIKIEPP